MTTEAEGTSSNKGATETKEDEVLTFRMPQDMFGVVIAGLNELSKTGAGTQQGQAAYYTFNNLVQQAEAQRAK